MPIGKIEEFDLTSKKWLAYIRRVEQFITLNGIKTELQVATLVTLVGAATYDLMCDLCAPNHPESKTFRELVNIVSDHLEPKRSEIAERHVFRQRRQNIGESLSEYLQALKHLASTCNFNTTLEENLRDQFVSGLASNEMRSRIFSEPSITYKKAVELALALEAAERHSQTSGANMAGAASVPYEAVHRVASMASAKRTGQPPDRGTASNGSSSTEGSAAASRSTRVCWRCGRNHRPDVCRFKSYSCDLCGQKGHIKIMCKSNKGRGVGSSQDISTQARRGHNNYLENSDNESACDLNNFSVRGVSDKPYTVMAQVNGRKISFELDTGSKLSVISLDCYNNKFSDLQIISSDISLYSYDGSIINPVGFVSVHVVIGEYTAGNLKLYIVKNGGPPLLGRSWLTKLNIHKISIDEFLFKLNESNLVEQLQREFPTVFASGLGTCTRKMSLKLVDKNPVFIKARSLPLALRIPVERELERLEAEGIIRKVDYSDYGTPIVPVIKKNGEIRICGDYKVTVNPKLMREPYPLPRIEELFAALSGGEQFTKIDLTHAYQQLLLDEESQTCTAISTHIGTFVYNRTPFGLTCIPEKFQKFMEETVKGLKGVAVFIDDIACTGATRGEHINNLKALLSRLREAGLRININKCTFMQDSIIYVGFVIDKHGLHPDENKIKAIVEAPRPNDVSQLRSFLGMVNYYAKFISNLSSILYPLHKLLRKMVEWVWSSDCDDSFNKIKKAILGSKVLVHYNPELPLVLAVDSSSYGIGSVLSHRYPNGDERPICFASRTLNSAERGYSQLDKEALAIVSGVMKHHQYLYGRAFIIKTDHKPLTFIFGPKHGLPQTVASRLQRYATKLAAYDFTIEFVKSKDNYNVDALSRLPLPYQRKLETGLDTVSYVNYVEESIPISARDVSNKTQDDEVLKNVYNYLVHGWPSVVTQSEEKPYFNRKDSLTIDRGCILYNHRVVIPKTLRKQVLNELHEGHLGVVKMKNISRSYVYWPQLDNEIETLCHECSACLQQRDAPPRAQLHPWAFPTRPWQRLNIDFAMFQGKYYLVTVDAYSKWIEVQKMRGTNASCTISKLRELFARFGIPSHIISDGGPPFTSSEFTIFLNNNLIKHTITSPYRPAANGAAENAVKLVKRAMKKAIHEGKDVDTAISKFLFQHRNCEHATTGVAPAVAMLGRRLRGRLDNIIPSTERAVEASAERAGRARPGAERHVQPGEHVLARDYRAHADKWAAATVLTRTDPLTYKVRVADGQEWKRHIDQLLPLKQRYSRHSITSSTDKPVAEMDASELSRDNQVGNTSSSCVVETDQNPEELDVSTDIITNKMAPETAPISDKQIARIKRQCLFQGKYAK